MKKLLMLTAAMLVFSAPAAFAEDGEGMKDGHYGGGKMFEKGDLDGDGVITKAEFMESHEKRFTAIDTDGNGEISKEEAQAMGDKMHDKMKEKRAERLRNRAERLEGGEEEPSSDE